YDRTVCWLEPRKWTKIHADEPSNTPVHPDDGNMFENMLRLTLLVLTGCALQLCAAAAAAETRQFANTVYELPPGWEPHGRVDGRLELRYPGDDDRCRDCRILIDPGTEGGGPIREW